MCTGLEIAAIAGTALSAHSAIEASNARSDAKAERNKLAAEAKRRVGVTINKQMVEQLRQDLTGTAPVAE